MQSGGECSPHALALLPRQRQIIAARIPASFSAMAEFDQAGEGAPVLSALAEPGNPAGPATHLLLAYGLGARRSEDQLSAVDALLGLAARGQLDTKRLGQESPSCAG